MISPENRRYVEIMAESVDAAFEATPVTTKMGQTALHELQLGAQDYLRGLDWQRTDLLPVLMYGRNDEPVYIEPGLYANRLLTAAFTEARSIMRGCLEQTLGMVPGDVSRNQLLKNSKQSLLTVARLDDDDKTTVLMAPASPGSSFAQHTFGHMGRSIIELRQNDTAQWRFDWKGPVRTWIADHRGTERGCPAAFHVMNDESQTVLHTFWDRLVDRAWPE